MTFSEKSFTGRILFVGVLMIVLFATSCSTQHASTASSNQKIDKINSHSGALSANSKNNNASKQSINSGAKALQQKFAELLDVPASHISNLKLYGFVNEWLSVPYQYGGKSKAGVDCSGFASLLYEKVYGNKICCSSSTIYEQCTSLKKDELQEGDFVFFKIKGVNISHVGIYLQHDKFIHASTQLGVTISDLNEPYYRKYFYKGGRLKY